MTFKKKILLIGFMFMGMTMHSQILMALLFGDKLNSDGLEYGIETGVNWSDITGLEAKKRLMTFNLGSYFDIRIKNQWTIHTGVLMMAKLGDNHLTENDLEFLGIEPYETNGSYSQKISYFILPALMKYNFKNRLYLEIGPQFGVKYNAWVKFESDTDGKEIEIKDFNKSNVNWLDVGISAGAGFKLSSENGMAIGVNYYHGFTNVYKGESRYQNNAIFLKLNLSLGTKKEKNESN